LTGVLRYDNISPSQGGKPRFKRGIIMNLALLLSQLISCNCNFRIFKYNPEYGGYSLQSNRDYRNKSLKELISYIPERVELAKDTEAIIYDIFLM
jgi:hypothetical protein